MSLPKSHLDIRQACSILNGTSELVGKDPQGEWFALDLPFATYDALALEWLCAHVPDTVCFIDIAFRGLTNRGAKALARLLATANGKDSTRSVSFGHLHLLTADIARTLLEQVEDMPILSVTVEQPLGTETLSALLPEFRVGVGDMFSIHVPSLSTAEAELFAESPGSTYLELRDGMLSREVAEILSNHAGANLGMRFNRRLTAEEWDWLCVNPLKCLQRHIGSDDAAPYYELANRDAATVAYWADSGISSVCSYP